MATHLLAAQARGVAWVDADGSCFSVLPLHRRRRDPAGFWKPRRTWRQQARSLSEGHQANANHFRHRFIFERVSAFQHRGVAYSRRVATNRGLLLLRLHHFSQHANRHADRDHDRIADPLLPDSELHSRTWLRGRRSDERRKSAIVYRSRRVWSKSCLAAGEGLRSGSLTEQDTCRGDSDVGCADGPLVAQRENAF